MQKHYCNTQTGIKQQVKKQEAITQTGPHVQTMQRGLRMQAEAAYTERYKQEAGTAYRNICDSSDYRWETPQNDGENNSTNIL